MAKIPLFLLAVLCFCIVASDPGTETGLDGTQPRSSRSLLAVVTNSDTQYTVDWNTVPGSPTPRNLNNVDLATCTCDLTSSQCDALCCCDPDCTSTEQSTVFPPRCLPDGTAPSPIPKCAELDKVNSRDPNLKIVPNPSFLDRQLCVAYDNNPSRGEYYPPNIPLPTTDDEFKNLIDKRAPFNFIPKQVASPVTFAENQPYKAGERIGALYGSRPTSLTSLPPWYQIGAGGLPLFVPGPDGACTWGNDVGFMEDVPLTSCVVRLPNYLQSCASDPWLRWDLYASRVTDDRADAWAGLFLELVSHPDPRNWAIQGLSSSGSSATGDTVIPVALTQTSLPLPRIDISSGNATTGTLCQNVVVKVAWTFSTNGAGRISSATADVTLGAISSNTFVRNMSVSWVRDASADRRPRSGRPGYQAGKPVLAGALVTQDSRRAVSQFVDGLTLLTPGPGSLAGDCVTSIRTQALFGNNMRTSCRVTMTLKQLAAKCNARQLDPVLQLPTGPLYVGAWGDSDSRYITDWVPLEVLDKAVVDMQSGAVQTQFVDTESRCANYVNRLSIEFLTVRSGSVRAPQRRILAAKARYYAVDWTFRKPSPRVTDTASAVEPAEPFTFETSVTFVEMEDIPQIFHPPAPPLLPSVPQDVFYPFILTNAAPASPSAPLLLPLLAALFPLAVARLFSR